MIYSESLFNSESNAFRQLRSYIDYKADNEFKCVIGENQVGHHTNLKPKLEFQIKVSSWMEIISEMSE